MHSPRMTAGRSLPEACPRLGSGDIPSLSPGPCTPPLPATLPPHSQVQSPHVQPFLAPPAGSGPRDPVPLLLETQRSRCHVPPNLHLPPRPRASFPSAPISPSCLPLSLLPCAHPERHPHHHCLSTRPPPRHPHRDSCHHTNLTCHSPAGNPQGWPLFSGHSLSPARPHPSLTPALGKSELWWSFILCVGHPPTSRLHEVPSAGDRALPRPR